MNTERWFNSLQPHGDLISGMEKTAALSDGESYAASVEKWREVKEKLAAAQTLGAGALSMMGARNLAHRYNNFRSKMVENAVRKHVVPRLTPITNAIADIGDATIPGTKNIQAPGWMSRMGKNVTDGMRDMPHQLPMALSHPETTVQIVLPGSSIHMPIAEGVKKFMPNARPQIKMPASPAEAELQAKASYLQQAFVDSVGPTLGHYAALLKFGSITEAAFGVELSKIASVPHLVGMLRKKTVKKGVGQIKPSVEKEVDAIPAALDTPGVSKTAGHVERRARQRAPHSSGDIAKIRAALPGMKLKRGRTYHIPVTGGYAVIADVGKRRRHHVIKTILGAGMKPPGAELRKQAAEQYHGSRRKLKRLRKGSYVTPYKEDALSFAVPWSTDDLVDAGGPDGRPPQKLKFKGKPPRDHKIYLYRVKAPSKKSATNTGAEYDWNRTITAAADVELVATIPSWKKEMLVKEGAVDRKALLSALKESLTKKPGKEHLKAWSRHAALNAGQASWFARRGKPAGTAENLVYAALPPTHHTKKDMAGMMKERSGKRTRHRDWFKWGRGDDVPEPSQITKVSFEIEMQKISFFRPLIAATRKLSSKVLTNPGLTDVAAAGWSPAAIGKVTGGAAGDALGLVRSAPIKRQLNRQVSSLEKSLPDSKWFGGKKSNDVLHQLKKRNAARYKQKSDLIRAQTRKSGERIGESMGTIAGHMEKVLHDTGASHMEKIARASLEVEFKKIAEAGGFWRKLPPGQTGHDQGGNEQQGRTWIKHESKLKEFVKLKKHQKDFSDTVSKTPKKGIIAAHGTGTGKTVSAIAAFERLKGEGKARRALVIAPAGLRKNFADSVGKFTGSKSVTISNAKSEVPADVDYVVVSYAAFRRDPQSFIDAYQPDTLIADEFHRAGNPDSSTHKAIAAARKQIPNFMGLTASIAQNDSSDAVPLVQLASKGEAPIKTKKQFNRQHTENVKTPQKGVFGGAVKERKLKNKEQLYNRIGGNIHYIEDLNATEKPPKEVQDVSVPMSQDQLKAYKMAMSGVDPAIQKKISLGTMLSKKETMHAFTSLMRARQISNSMHLANPNMSTRQAAESTPKIKKVMDDVQKHLNETPDGKVIIYTNLVKGGVDVISAGLKGRGVEFGVFAGKSMKGMTEKSRQQAVEDYQAGKKRVIIITGAGAEGLSLGNTTMVAMADGHYNPERMNQAAARGIRAGGQSHRPVEERKVVVNRYVSAVPRSFWQKITLQDQKEKSVGQWVYATADRKSKNTRELRDVLQRRHDHEKKKRNSRMYRLVGGGP
jgi:superfamily II DNA or RNA helicase